MKRFLIYQIKNKLNNKIYVGKHITDNVNDSYMGSGVRIQRAIKKYGIENFEKTILVECSSEEEMNAKEAEIVNDEFLSRDDVYNINKGGEGGWHYVNKTHKNIGFYYINSHGLTNKGKTISEALKQRMKEGVRRSKLLHPERFSMNGERNPFYGKKHSAASKLLMSINAKLNNNMKDKMWIKNPIIRESKVQYKWEPIPEGWEKGRYMPKY